MIVWRMNKHIRTIEQNIQLVEQLKSYSLPSQQRTVLKDQGKVFPSPHPPYGKLFAKSARERESSHKEQKARFLNVLFPHPHPYQLYF